MAASYPSSSRAFTTKLDGPSHIISASHVNDLQDEVVAVENGLINGLAHDLKFPDASYDIGKTGATRPRDIFTSRDVTVGRNATIAGTFGVTGTTTLAGLIGGSTTVTITTTGTQNNYAPGLVGNTIVLCNNASGLTITGIAGGYQGQTVTFITMNAAGQVNFLHNSGSSSAGNKLINIATTGATAIAAAADLGGLVTYQWETALNAWRLIFHEQGAWITRTFAAGNYTASSGTWTVSSASRDAYWLKGRTCVYSFAVSGTTSGTPVTVKITLPFTAAAADSTAYYVSLNGAAGAEGGYCNTSAGSALLNAQRFANTAFAAGTVALLGQITAEVT